MGKPQLNATEATAGEHSGNRRSLQPQKGVHSAQGSASNQSPAHLVAEVVRKQPASIMLAKSKSAGCSPSITLSDSGSDDDDDDDKSEDEDEDKDNK